MAARARCRRKASSHRLPMKSLKLSSMIAATSVPMPQAMYSR
jgi:hypothetical protein